MTTITESLQRSQAYQPLVVVSFHLYIVPFFFAVYHYSSFVSYSITRVTVRVTTKLTDSFSRNIFLNVTENVFLLFYDVMI